MLRAVIGLAAMAGLVAAGEDIEKVYKGFRDRQYIVHLPTGYSPEKQYPLVMVLHGCSQTHKVIKSDTDMDALSDAEEFIAVYPFITSYTGIRNQNCWGFWFPAEIQRGRGEVADLAGIVAEVSGDHNIDSDRVHITGLSSGGAMTVVAGVAYPDVFASIAPGAGIGYGETSSSVSFSCLIGPSVISAQRMAQNMNSEMAENKRRLPVLILHSTSDCTVQIINAERIRDSWGIEFDIDTRNPTSVESGTTEGKKWVYTKYGDSEGDLIETHWVDGLSHGWVGGNRGTYSFPDGPDWSKIAWEFFKNNPRGGARAQIAISSATATGTCIDVTGTYTDPRVEVKGVQVRFEGDYPTPPMAGLVNAGDMTWSFRQCDLVDDNYYTPFAVATDPSGDALSDEVSSDRVKVGNPPVQAPAVSLDAPATQLACVTLTGSAVGEGSLTVESSLSSSPSFDPVDASDGSFSINYCSLDEGTYTIDVRATDTTNDLSTTTTSAAFEISVPGYEDEVTSNLGDHVAAQRVKTYTRAQGCVGFGSCDTIYNTLFLKYGSSTTFPLYKRFGDNVWYEEVANIPATKDAGFTYAAIE